jgi:hypothetical protein
MSDERLKKVLGEGRENRLAYDRAATESRELSDDARVEMFRQQFIQAALPDLPKIPGYHTCWLTTTNPRDSIQSRIRLGYEPIKPEEVPGWEYVSIKTGEWTGFVGVNEMLAFKLPMSLYKKYMQAVHYDAPNEEEERLVGANERMREQAERAGSRMDEGDGMSAIRESAKVRAPTEWA